MNEKPDFDLNALSQTWRSDAGPDLASTRADVRAALMRARIAFAFEAVIALAGIAVGGLLLGSGVVLPGVATLLFAGFAGAAAVYARGRSWRVSIDAVTNELAKLDIEARNLKRTGWAGLCICAAALIFVAVLVAGDGAGVAERSRMVIAGALVFIAANILVSARALVAAMKRIDRIRRLKAAYSDAPQDG